MSTSSGTAGIAPRSTAAPRPSAVHQLRRYFASDSLRTTQSVLGLLWLLDGALQLQSFMYTKGFIQTITANEAGQPGWLHDSIAWGARIAGGDLTVWNTLFALTQLAIGLGLLYRPTVKPALLLSFFWAPLVWWFGEGFGMLLMNMAQPLTGAPGAVILYALVGLAAWPTADERPGGLLGVRGTRIMWAALWLVMAWLWLTGPNTGANTVTDIANAAPSGMSWLSSLQEGVASAARGDGLVIALILAAASAAIGIAVAAGWRPRRFLILAVALNIAYWLVGQGLGGMFEGGATDPNAAPLFILLAYVLWTLVPYRVRSQVVVADAH